jgi:hypothetical protein
MSLLLRLARRQDLRERKSQLRFSICRESLHIAARLFGCFAAYRALQFQPLFRISCSKCFEILPVPLCASAGDVAASQQSLHRVHLPISPALFFDNGPLQRDGIVTSVCGPRIRRKAGCGAKAIRLSVDRDERAF